MSERLAMTPLDQAIYALCVARPYVYNTLRAAHADAQGASNWREETALSSLDVVDATIARLRARDAA